MPWSIFSMFRHRFPWIQVEVTTHCQAACSYCPRTVYRDRWEDRHLALETFQRLLPDLPRADLVYLQGWGEPFLHPDFFTLVSLAKEAGCRAGVTTNGMLLDKERLARLVDLEVAVVAFSLAGVGEKNDVVRRGTRFATVLDHLKKLHDLKLRKGAVFPQVHVAYMLLRSGLEDLPRLPQALEGLGVSQVVVSTLDFVASLELARESLRLMEPEDYRDLLARLDDLAARGRRQGLTFSHHLPAPGHPSPTCPENVGRAVCVAADGAVTPCVYLNLPILEAYHVTQEGERPYQRLTFGGLGRQPLREIWRDPAYRRFRQDWRRRKLAPFCRGCLKLS